MIKIKSEPLVEAVKRTQGSQARKAYLAGTTPATLRKLVNGQPVAFDAISTIASYYGLDVEVTFKKRPKTDVATN